MLNPACPFRGYEWSRRVVWKAFQRFTLAAWLSAGNGIFQQSGSKRLPSWTWALHKHTAVSHRLHSFTPVPNILHREKHVNARFSTCKNVNKVDTLIFLWRILKLYFNVAGQTQVLVLCCHRVALNISMKICRKPPSISFNRRIADLSLQPSYYS